jgi:release factor glutamine methyltransferase
VTLRELEREMKTQLQAAFADPAFETRQILSATLQINSGELLFREDKEVDAAAVEKSRHWASERARGIPLAYLTGVKGFYKHEFFVEPGVLVPRPESEHIVEVALQRVGEQKLHIKNLADLGCGSGILGLSLALEFPQSTLWAVDNSQAARRVTLRNAEKLGVRNRMQMIERGVESFKPNVAFELIVANPPYIAEGDAAVEASVHQHEPHSALYAGENGLADIRAWSQWSSRHLVKNGLFVCEIGASQSAAARDIMAGLKYKDIRITKDLAGHDRVISANWSEHG